MKKARPIEARALQKTHLDGRRSRNRAQNKTILLMQMMIVVSMGNVSGVHNHKHLTENEINTTVASCQPFVKFLTKR